MMEKFSTKSILVILFLFFIGCILGWCIEVIFRRFFSKANPTRKWINPGFLIGPYLPLYGSGLVVLYLLSLIHIDALEANPILYDVVIVIVMTVAMTVVEYIAGRIFIVGMHIKLWDYSNEWGNIQGVICPRFSFYWGVISALYYFCLHPRVLRAVYWLSGHLTFSFFIGFFYGVFVIDCVVSFNLMGKVKKLADEYEIVVRVEELKQRIAIDREKRREKPSFFLLLRDYAAMRRSFEDHAKGVSITQKIKETAEQISDTIREKGEAFSESIREKGEAISDSIKAAGSEAASRIEETLSRNDSSDVADNDLFDGSYKVNTDSSCKKAVTNNTDGEKSNK